MEATVKQNRSEAVSGRKNNGGIAGIIVLAAFGILTLIGALRHELWFDEAQAWLIARDNDIAGIFKQLNFEGHPPLWYLILFIFTRLGCSCSVIPLISWAVMLVSAVVIMRKAPFSTFVKSAVILSGGFIYFNTVMSRVYCLIYIFCALIACLYPKRKEHPLLYGLLIALLANTHVCMSGFIGMLGIFMLIDLIKGWKTNTKKQNILEIAGMVIAAAGVLLLVLPLLGSVSANPSTNENVYTVRGVLSSIAGVFSSISFSAMEFDENMAHLWLNIIEFLLSVCLFIKFLLLRHKTRAFWSFALFLVCYIITSEIVWFTIPNRAHIFIFMFFICGWLAEYEEKNSIGAFGEKIADKCDSGMIKSFLKFIAKTDGNSEKSYITLMTAVMLVTAPTGFYYLFSDYAKAFCPAKYAAEYIEENLPEDSFFVGFYDDFVAVAAYLPDTYTFYSMQDYEFYSYIPHTIPEDTGEGVAERIRRETSGHEHIYLMERNLDITVPHQRKVYYAIDDGIPFSKNVGFGTNLYSIMISEFDYDQDVRSFLSIYYKSDKSKIEKELRDELGIELDDQ